MNNEDDDTGPRIVVPYGGVGYCKPPVGTRFQKGKSGNPSGSTQKQRATDELNQLILQESYRLVTVWQGKKKTRMPAIAAIARSQLAKALKGSGPAQRASLNLVRSVEGNAMDGQMSLLKNAMEYKADAEREIARRKKAGIKDFSDIVPHPDDVLINAQTGRVHFLKGVLPKDQAKLRKLGLKR